MKYRVMVIETMCADMEIEASSRSEAYSKAVEMHGNGDFDAELKDNWKPQWIIKKVS